MGDAEIETKRVRFNDWALSVPQGWLFGRSEKDGWWCGSPDGAFTLLASRKNLKWDGVNPDGGNVTTDQAEAIAARIKDGFAALDGSVAHHSEKIDDDYLISAVTDYREGPDDGDSRYRAFQWVRLVSFEGWLSAERLSLIVPRGRVKTTETKRLVQLFESQIQNNGKTVGDTEELLRPFIFQKASTLCLPANWIDELDEEERFTYFFDPRDTEELVSLSVEGSYFGVPPGTDDVPALSQDDMVPMLENLAAKVTEDENAVGVSVKTYPQGQALWYEISNQDNTATRYWCHYNRLFPQTETYALVSFTFFVDHKVLHTPETARLMATIQREVALANIGDPGMREKPRPGRTFLPEPPILLPPQAPDPLSVSGDAPLIALNQPIKVIFNGTTPALIPDDWSFTLNHGEWSALSPVETYQYETSTLPAYARPNGPFPELSPQSPIDLHLNGLLYQFKSDPEFSVLGQENIGERRLIRTQCDPNDGTLIFQWFVFSPTADGIVLQRQYLSLPRSERLSDETLRLYGFFNAAIEKNPTLSIASSPSDLVTRVHNPVSGESVSNLLWLQPAHLFDFVYLYVPAGADHELTENNDYRCDFSEVMGDIFTLTVDYTLHGLREGMEEMTDPAVMADHAEGISKGLLAREPAPQDLKIETTRDGAILSYWSTDGEGQRWYHSYRFKLLEGALINVVSKIQLAKSLLDDPEVMPVIDGILRELKIAQIDEPPPKAYMAAQT